MALIKNIKDARAAIGSRVWWDTPSGRYEGDTRSGILTEVLGKNLVIDGDYKWRPHLNNLRTTEQK